MGIHTHMQLQEEKLSGWGCSPSVFSICSASITFDFGMVCHSTQRHRETHLGHCSTAVFACRDSTEFPHQEADRFLLGPHDVTHHFCLQGLDGIPAAGGRKFFLLGQIGQVVASPAGTQRKSRSRGQKVFLLGQVRQGAAFPCRDSTGIPQQGAESVSSWAR